MNGCTYAAIISLEDQEYMTWLYQEFHRLMFFTAKRFLSSRPDCEDAVQDSLLHLIGKIETLRGLEPRALTSYIVSTVRNTSINHLKLMAKRRACGDYPAGAAPAVPAFSDSLTALVCCRDQLSSVLTSLSDEDCFLLEGKYFEGYSDAELAYHLHCQPNSIRMKLSRARRRAVTLLFKMR